MRNKLSICLSLLLLCQTAINYAQNFCLDCLTVRIGNATMGRGPTPGRPDNPFNLYSTLSGVVAYSNDVTSYSISNPSSTGSGGFEQIAFSPVPGTFTAGGGWIESLLFDGSTYYAVIHGEAANSQCLSGIHKSMGIATSNNPFTNFALQGQTIDRPDGCGEGDGTVIHWSDGNNYLYLLRAYDFSEIFAKMTSGNYLNWLKYYCPVSGIPGSSDCGFTGTGTQETPIVISVQYPGQSIQYLTMGGGAVASWNSNVILMGQNDGNPQVGGMAISFSSDMLHFTALKDPLIPLESAPNDHTLYLSIADPNQPNSNQLVNNNSLELFYTYSEPFVTLNGSNPRYLVSRSVSWNVGTQSVWPQVGIELSRYFQPGTWAHWGTTAMATPLSNWTYEGSLGYLMTRNNPNAPAQLVPLYDCKNGASDWMNSTSSNCEGTTKLRLLGYIYSPSAPQQPNTQPIYRCILNTWYHMTSRFSNCENAGTNEGMLGYTLIQ